VKIFISHSSKDKKYGECILQLLLDIGISSNDIVFTSKPGFGIPKGQNIFQWLKKKLVEKPFVIYLLSNNYYNSIACLNEMGAAWVIENKHITIFTPEFDTKNSQFYEGAIDPREIGIFLTKKADIVEFVDNILIESKHKVNAVVINNAIIKYFEQINSDIELLNEDSGEKKLSEELLPDDKKIKLKSGKTSFYDDIIQNKLSEEELLLIKFMSDTGNIKLGFRWMAEETIEEIRKWQDNNNIISTLIDKYKSTVEKLQIRKYLIIYSETSYGNPREFILIDKISENILNLPNNIVVVLDENMENCII